VLADRGFVQSGFNDVPHLGVQTFVPRWDLVEPSEIPTQVVRVFRFDVGHRSDLNPANIPI
jgi:hypothetical protein